MPRLAERKYADCVVSLPSASVNHGGPHWRVSSPVTGLSTFITSAPKSARIWVHQGPAITLDKSSTRIPFKGPVNVLPRSLLLGFPRHLLGYDQLLYLNSGARYPPIGSGILDQGPS